MTNIVIALLLLVAFFSFDLFGIFGPHQNAKHSINNNSVNTIKIKFVSATTTKRIWPQSGSQMDSRFFLFYFVHALAWGMTWHMHIRLDIETIVLIHISEPHAINSGKIMSFCCLCATYCLVFGATATAFFTVLPHYCLFFVPSCFFIIVWLRLFE